MKLSNMLNSAMVFSAKSDVRYYLNGVNIYHDGTFIEAIASTDGHCMQLLTNDTDLNEDLGNFKSLILSNENCKRLIAIFPTQSVNEITLKEILDHIDPVSGNYPDVRRVIPSGNVHDGEIEIGMNYKYLAKISQSMIKLGKGYKSQVNGAIFKFKGASSSVRVEIDNYAFKGVKALIIIMPMRL